MSDVACGIGHSLECPYRSACAGATGNALYGISQISERIIEPNTEHGVQRDMARIIADIRAGGTGEIDFRAESTMIGRGAGVATDPGTKNN